MFIEHPRVSLQVRRSGEARRGELPMLQERQDSRTARFLHGQLQQKAIKVCQIDARSLNTHPFITVFGIVYCLNTVQ